MASGTLGRRLLLHIALRLVAATVLLGAALVVELRAPGDAPIDPFFALIAAVYAVSLAFIASLRYVHRYPMLIDVHFAIDILMVSAAVALTGGITSLFSILYVLPILAASSVEYRRGAVQVAALSAIVYAAVVLTQSMQSAGYLGPLLGLTIGGEMPSARVAEYTVGLNVFGFFAVALLSGSLAERVRRADVRLVQASEEIADLQFFNQYVIDHLLSGLATADGDNRILTFNRSAVQITGHSTVSALEQPAVEILQLPGGFADHLDEELLRVRSKRVDLQYRRTDGRVIMLGLSVAQLPLPDRRLGYLYTFQDVTDVRRLERDAQLQKRLAAVGEMAAGIAHEIRNPLASMSGSMQILRQELRLSSDQAQLMDIVLRESDRLNDTIRSFLAYARPQRFEVQPLDLRRVVSDTATLLRNSPERGEKHVIEVLLAEDVVTVDADENQIRQIVWNLATNGLRAMPDGGRLTLSAACGADPTVGVLRVTDEGVGIPAEELDGIFQPFRGSFGKGSGLGLAIIHRIVSDYNARIDVDSQMGRGTTFTVTFPASMTPRTPAAGDQQGSSASPPGALDAPDRAERRAS
jgi:two-component system sensor histidine kinase PilS (NtrC family)